MVRLFGPKVPRYRYEVDGRNETFRIELDGLQVEAHTLLEALKSYGIKFNLTILPYNNQTSVVQIKKYEDSKYFWLEDLGGDGSASVVDIHVERFELEMCAKQKLEIELKDGDVIIICPLV